MACPKELKYTKEHIWARIDGDNVVVGITDFAQSELGDIVFVELPALDMEIEKDASFCVVESTKAASDIYAPVAGTVVAVNDVLSDNPGTVNSDPYGDGWLAKIANFDKSAFDALMSAEEYEALITQ